MRFDVTKFGIVIGAVIVLLVIAGVAVMLIRRRMLAPDEPGPGAGFTLEDLRAMRERGEISDVEFRTARDAMVARLRASREAETGEADRE